LPRLNSPRGRGGACARAVGVVADCCRIVAVFRRAVVVVVAFTARFFILHAIVDTIGAFIATPICTFVNGVCNCELLEKCIG
jgi:hypothetical protein